MCILRNIVFFLMTSIITTTNTLIQLYNKNKNLARYLFAFSFGVVYFIVASYFSNRTTIAFPELYDIAENKNAMVGDYLLISGTMMTWNPMVSRTLNDWEVETMKEFLVVLYSFPISRNSHEW